ncbi:MAG: hypothetical protein GY717_01230 [Rhodobacteraceae bacterium]|nr:hypothetical protein [Paracoccaceae bacterium]
MESRKPLAELSARQNHCAPGNHRQRHHRVPPTERFAAEHGRTIGQPTAARE